MFTVFREMQVVETKYWALPKDMGLYIPAPTQAK